MGKYFPQHVYRINKLHSKDYDYRFLLLSIDFFFMNPIMYSPNICLIIQMDIAIKDEGTIGDFFQLISCFVEP
jgi:hypothetical protein